MIKKIGVENFRVFKEYTEFELRPITLLTGPNNSGKSSLIKLLLLIKTGISSFEFKSGNHNLEDFEKILNWDSGSKNLKLRLDPNIPFFKNIDVEYLYKKNNIYEINLYHSQQCIINYSYKIGAPKEDWGSHVDIGYGFYYEFLDININAIIGLVYDGNYEILNNWKEMVPEHPLPKHVNPKIDNVKTNYNIDNYKSSNENPEHSLDIKAVFAIYNEVQRLDKNYLLYELFIEDQDCTKDYLEEIVKIQEIVFQEINFEEDPENPSGALTNKFASFSHSFLDVEDQAHQKIEEYFVNKIPDLKIELKPTTLNHIIFSEQWFAYDTSNVLDKNRLFDQLFNFDLNFENERLELDFISANRGNQKRVLQNESESEIDKIVAEFVDGGKKNQDFLANTLKILGIKGNLVPERFENTISVVYIQNGDQKVSLADLGYGFSQVIPIILKIIMSGDHLIIEEPEANLHPNLQSKFADLLLTTIRAYPRKKFIIETHSEYLIRKLQFLTAKKDLSTDDTLIYYFNADEYVNHEEPKVKKIEITGTGNLTENFGPGFYDEATRLQFDLMKIKKDQEN
ncbi:DUF3696 domain-containing protein [Christiangramia sabulilitoris]|uniref:DUF3696 domain-containing protein n=1 Tax=Christiangramia sabulilitoris TaxID=2583991 RepID=A0A550I7K5_9FLAO|nr:DUF3696 domain-containing protein [Christiangramia sabulilitoris]TRO66956.1 DUF3696 domain-containing protein [Christiangramia sabulilitoris]